jgi:hypothetical protein
MNEDQRAEWKRALAAKARQQRSQRYGPQARGVRILKGRAFTGAGMVRLPAARKQPRATP